LRAEKVRNFFGATPKVWPLFNFLIPEEIDLTANSPELTSIDPLGLDTDLRIFTECQNVLIDPLECDPLLLRPSDSVYALAEEDLPIYRSAKAASEGQHRRHIAQAMTWMQDIAPPDSGSRPRECQTAFVSSPLRTETRASQDDTRWDTPEHEYTKPTSHRYAKIHDPEGQEPLVIRAYEEMDAEAASRRGSRIRRIGRRIGYGALILASEAAGAISIIAGLAGHL
jgi:hypothetical protein